MLVIGLVLTFAGMIAALAVELRVFHVIASEAKQSIVALCRDMDCFACARNDG